MKTILFINRKEPVCGIYQYGIRVYKIISNSQKYRFIYCEVGSQQEYENYVNVYEPSALIYNYVSFGVMKWLTEDLMRNYPHIKHLKLCHEDETILLFEAFINDVWEIHYPVYWTARPIFENLNFEYKHNEIPIIGSFGFAFTNKNFDKICKIVNEEFEEAIIRIHTPSIMNDIWGVNERLAHVKNLCEKQITKPGIKLEITGGFLTNEELLKFLSENTINVFLYDTNDKGRGLSSVIDYAISVKRPIAISTAFMFRHISDTQPSICVEDSTLKQIIQNGPEVLDKYRESWKHENLIKDYENILYQTLK